MAVKGDNGRGGSDSASGRGGGGGGNAPGPKGSGGDKGGGNMAGTWGNRGPYQFMSSTNLHPQLQGLLAASPAPTAPPVAPPTQQPINLQGLMAQQPLYGGGGNSPFGNRFGPNHPLAQYLIGQTPRPGTPALPPNPVDPMAMIKKRFGDPRMA